ncbi:MAG: NACHT domain-containing protein [Deltaproteobacteria bacterium]|nr:NACHT domain-containing protein [Deltaproteobacteria bacterium]
MKNPVLMLHLSDLHFGAYSRFKGEDPEKLARVFHASTEDARQRLRVASPVAVVVVTGDIAETAKPAEYQTARTFFASLAQQFGLEHRCFVFVPGNHDVSWPACKIVAAEQEEVDFANAELREADLRRRFDAAKLARFDEFLKAFHEGGSLAEIWSDLGHGARLYRFPEYALSVAAMSSCERKSLRDADHVGFLGPEQAQAVMNAWRTTEAAYWLKVVAIHHNPGVVVPAGVADWRKALLGTGGIDRETLARYEADIVGFAGRTHLKQVVAQACVQLVLHGHEHASDERMLPWQEGGKAHVLSAGSACLDQKKLPAEEPLAIRLVLLDVAEKRVLSHRLVFEPRATPDGVISPGAFVPDAAQAMGYDQALDLPPGFDAAAPPAHLAPKAGPTVQADPAKYADRMRELYQVLDLSAMAPVGEETHPLALVDVFLPQDVREDPPPLELPRDLARRVAEESGEKTPSDESSRRTEDAKVRAELERLWRTYQDRPRRPMLDVVAGNRRVVLVGDPGSGKTTLSRFLLLSLLNAPADGAPPWRTLLRDHFPLLIELRNFIARRVEAPDLTFTSYLGHLGRTQGYHLDETWVDARLRSGPSLVIFFDGLDEIFDPAQRERTSREIAGFAATYTSATVLVTTRPVGYRKEPLQGAGFAHFRLEELTDPQIRSFVDGWFLRVFPDREEWRKQRIDRVLRACRDSASIRLLAGNPLLLTIMALMARQRELPEERWDFYNQAADVLCHHWDVNRHLEESGIPAT